MSLIKRFMDDEDELSEMAANAAFLDSPSERLRALTLVFQECGTRAQVYANPMEAARILVKGAVLYFRFNRMLASWEMEAQGA
ncbi:hypothetical protein [Streptomyces sp. NPDC005281]|uniref:hypothetical protein n=1 Tax=Streptomyces sp. NPDC005281 TaxID=3155712 RepID=UPI0033A23DA3